MEKFVNIVDKATKFLAQIAGWLAILMMVFQAFCVVARYVFNFSLISFQEAVVYGHAMLFLFGAAYILQINQHVRVDIFYSKMSANLRHKVDAITLLIFVLPVAFTLLYFGTPYILNAWENLEGSRQAGGLPAVFLLKTCIGIFAITLVLQAISLLARLFTNPQFKWDGE